MKSKMAYGTDRPGCGAWDALVGDARNIVFIGESGCGKTELAVNCAIALQRREEAKAAGGADRPAIARVTLIDMDQSKPVFRSRDLREAIEAERVELLYGEQMLESPTVPPGIKKRLMDKEGYNVLDVGGNEIGAVNMGQFEGFFDGDDTIVFFVVSPYRLLSLDGAHIAQMMKAVEEFSRLRNYRIIGNPNMGEYTDAEVVTGGWTMIQERFAEPELARLALTCDVLALPEWLAEEIEPPEGCQHVLSIRRYLQYP